jgi:hypothetical protein
MFNNYNDNNIEENSECSEDNEETIINKNKLLNKYSDLNGIFKELKMVKKDIKNYILPIKKLIIDKLIITSDDDAIKYLETKYNLLLL